MASIWGRSRLGVTAIGLTLLFVFAYYALSYFLSPHAGYPVPGMLFAGIASFFAAIFVGRSQKEDNPNAGSILTFVQDNPGCTAPELARGSGMNIGTVRYHIKKLEDEGRIALEKIGKFSRIFLNSHSYGDREKLVAAHLRSESSRQIITTLMATPGISNQQLSERLGMEKSLAYRYLQRLLEDGIVTYELEGKSKLYYIDMGAKEAIVKLMPLHYQCPGLKKE